MSKKQQYTTKFYEGNGGVIDAVTRDESGKVVNVQNLTHWQRMRLPPFLMGDGEAVTITS